MKLSNRFIATLFACFAIYFILPSCGHNFTRRPEQVLNGPINITRYDASDNTLTLQDNNGNDASWVLVTRKMKIDWNLTSSLQPKIVITGIRKDTNFAQNDSAFFSSAPQGNSDHWQAVIGDSAQKKGTIEKYYIEWKEKGKLEKHTFDPLLQLNPQ